MPEPAHRARSPLSALLVGASLVRLHIVAIACLATSVFGWAFTGHWWWLAVGCAAVDWFVINLLNRVADLEEDRINGVLGADVASRYPRALSALCWVALIGSLVASHVVAPALTPWRILCHLIGFPYNFRLLPGGARFKELYALKNLASGAIFLVTVLAYPLALAFSEGGGGLLADVTWTTVALSGAFFLAFELSYEVIYDLRDAPGDAEAKVPTFPVVHGPVVAARIADALIFTSMVVLVGGHVSGHVPWRVAVMLVAPVVHWILYRRWQSRGLEGADCVALTWIGALQLALYHGWVAVGLPLARPF
jgi:4-hydroxybenzoate polyprenyltransferase